MTRRRAAAVLLLVLGGLITVFAGSAAAGGPTSVLLVAPNDSRTASLHLTDPDYEELARVLDVFDDPRGEPAAAGGPGGGSVTVTWLIHDVSVWRVDRIDLDAKGGPTVVSQQAVGGGEIWDAPAVRYPVREGKALMALLERLDLVGSGSASAARPTVAEQAVGEQAVVRPAVTDRRPGPDGWVTGGLGVLVGMLLGAAAVLVLRRRGSSPGPDDPVDDAAPDDGVELLDSRVSPARV